MSCSNRVRRKIFGMQQSGTDGWGPTILAAQVSRVKEPLPPHYDLKSTQWERRRVAGLQAFAVVGLVKTAIGQTDRQRDPARKEAIFRSP